MTGLTAPAQGLADPDPLGFHPTTPARGGQKAGTSASGDGPGARSAGSRRGPSRVSPADRRIVIVDHRPRDGDVPRWVWWATVVCAVVLIVLAARGPR